MNKTPIIRVMGEHGMEEIPYHEVPESRALGLDDYFKPVKISPLAIDQASKFVPIDLWKKYGLYTWLSGSANHVFRGLTTEQYKGKLGLLNYVFEYDSDGPVLKTVFL